MVLAVVAVLYKKNIPCFTFMLLLLFSTRKVQLNTWL